MTASRPPQPGSLLGGMPRSVLALVGWTLFVWVTRIRNIVTDEELTGWSTIWRLGLAGAFVMAAAVVVVAALVRPALVPNAARTLAAFSVAVWAIRGAAIAAGGHDPGFIAVHLVLAGVTIALALAVFHRFGPWPSSNAKRPGHTERPVSSVDDG